MCYYLFKKLEESQYWKSVINEYLPEPIHYDVTFTV